MNDLINQYNDKTHSFDISKSEEILGDKDNDILGDLVGKYNVSFMEEWKKY